MICPNTTTNLEKYIELEEIYQSGKSKSVQKEHIDMEKIYNSKNWRKFTIQKPLYQHRKKYQCRNSLEQCLENSIDLENSINLKKHDVVSYCKTSPMPYGSHLRAYLWRRMKKFLYCQLTLGKPICLRLQIVVRNFLAVLASIVAMIMFTFQSALTQYCQYLVIHVPKSHSQQLKKYHINRYIKF